MRVLVFLFAIFLCLSLVLSASPPSFCKCTCFTKSTIIKLGDSHASENFAKDLLTRASSGGSTCSQCNRAFCLGNNLPICKGAEEKDVTTTCFQRDSRKDQIIVLLFISATVGLLGWAAIKQVLEKKEAWGRARSQVQTPGQGQYTPVVAER